MITDMIIGGETSEREIEINPPGITIRLWRWKHVDEATYRVFDASIEWRGRVSSFCISTTTGLTVSEDEDDTDT